MAGRRVGILSDDQHADVGHWLAEGTQDAVAGRKVCVTSGDLLPQERAGLGQVAGHRLECLGPVGGNEVGPACHRRERSAMNWPAQASTSCSSTVRRMARMRLT